MARHRGIVGIALGAVAVAAACAVYDASLLTPSDGGADAGDGGGDVVACNAATYPSRPDGDEAGADVGELYFALRSFTLTVGADGGPPVGWDIDRQCTCPGPPSCIPPSGGDKGCDDDAGRDNAGGKLLQTFTSFATSYDAQRLNQRIQAGEFDLILRLRNYNGARNDTSVEASLFLSNGTVAQSDGGPKVPAFDGNDVWTIDPRSLLGGVAPPYIPQPNSVDTSAYVRDGVVVASLSNADIEFAAGAGLASLRVNMTGVVITARLEKNATGQWSVKEGVLDGRWPASKLLPALQSIRVPLTNEYLCGDSGTYASLKSLVCKSVDIVSSPQNDNTNAPCDSLAFILGFEAPPAKPGPVKAGPGQLQPCGAAWTDGCQ